MFLDDDKGQSAYMNTDRGEGTVFEPHRRNRAARFDLSETARLRIAKSLIRVRILDISVSGAKLDLCAESDCSSILEQFTPGTIVLLNIAAIVQPRLCQIRWGSGSRIGVQFNEPLSPESLDCVLKHDDLQARTSCLLRVPG